jgi:hypothetical protein
MHYARIPRPFDPALKISSYRASVYTGMKKCFVVALAVTTFLVVGCEQQPSAPAGGQPASSPTPESTAAPASTPVTTATPAPTAAATATPESPTPTATPEAVAPTPSPEAPAPTATPEAVAPIATPDAVAPTPTPDAATPKVNPGMAAPTATPETASPTPTPDATAPAVTPTPTPEASPTASPEAPATTPDAVSPSPTPPPSASKSDTRPMLSSKSANEYLQSYDDYISDFKTAYQAMKQGDVTKYRTVIQRAQELQTKSDKLSGELNPEEEQRFADYLNKKANELSQFALQNR